MIPYKYTDNEIRIAEWLGYQWNTGKVDMSCDPYWMGPDGYATPTGGIPHFETDDGAAITLFPVLLVKGFVPALFVAHIVPYQWQCDIAKSTDYEAVARGIQPTIAAAICAAMTQLIEATKL